MEGLGARVRKFCDTGGQDAQNAKKNAMLEGLTAELDALRQVEHTYCVRAIVRLCVETGGTLVSTLLTAELDAFKLVQCTD